MAVSKRPGRRKPWVSDNYELVPISPEHPNGKRRRYRFFATKHEADADDKKFHEEGRHERRAKLDPEITLAAYAEHWLSSIRPPVRGPRTVQSYEDTLRVHLLPR